MGLVSSFIMLVQKLVNSYFPKACFPPGGSQIQTLNTDEEITKEF